MTTVLDAGSAECLVFTRKAGLLSAAAHDLKLRVERFEIRVEAGRVEAKFDAGSLRVICAQAGGRDLPSALSAKDRAEIEATIAAKVLDSRRHPLIAFRSTQVAAENSAFRVAGTLALRGRERPFAVLARREGDRGIVEAAIHQPDFGIEPYSAMLGALRVKPEVFVKLSLPWSDGLPQQ